MKRTHLLAACLIGTASLFVMRIADAASVAVTTTDPLSVAIEAVTTQQMHPEATGIRGAKLAWAALLQEFYAARGFRAAWRTGHAATELRRAITDSELEGLDPRDYHDSLLDSIAREAAAPDAPDTLRAELDVLQTDALLRLGYHLAFGKVNPASFDAQWNYGRSAESLDAAKEIEAALAADDVYARVQALKPTHRLYGTLRELLTRYRAIAARGGWAAVPGGKVALKPGVRDERVPALRARLLAEGLIATSATSDVTLYDTVLDAGVRRFQSQNGLAADGTIGARTLEALNVPVADRILQLRVNLDRGRVLLQDLPRDFVVVNLAAFTIYLVQDDAVAWTSRVQEGKLYRRTPIFRSALNYLVLNPTWTVPPGIIENDILPEARKGGVGAFTRRHLDVLDRSSKIVDPRSIDWKRYKSGNIPYTLRQEPGPQNALGQVKFMFPNAYSVYLHDTPSKALFDSDERVFSSGCVRVEKPLELAQRLLADQSKWSADSIRKALEAGKTQNITLARRVPVLIAYWTAWVNDAGENQFRRDVYGQDVQWATGLKAAFTGK